MNFEPLSTGHARANLSQVPSLKITDSSSEVVEIRERAPTPALLATPATLKELGALERFFGVDMGGLVGGVAWLAVLKAFTCQMIKTKG